MAKNKHLLLNHKLKLYLANAEIIQYYRRNPVIACEDLLGIYLTDAQAWMLASSWNTERAVWSCCRNFGKSFIIAIYALLRAILYPNQNIYIVSSVGYQAKETFEKIEEIALRRGKTSESIPNLKDIVYDEIAKPKNNPTGFTHDPASYKVVFFNGSKIVTLNAKPDNVRGKRSSLTIFDEAAFCSEDLILSVEPFSIQSSSAKYGENSAILQNILPLDVPNQIIYASSQNTMDALFYKRYKEYAKKMLAGNRKYFVCDMPCDVAMKMYMKGEEVAPLITKEIVETALKNDPEAARREYYNLPDLSGGEAQIVKWGTIRNNEKQIIPYQSWKPDNKIILAFDPARTFDNSILSVMNVYQDEELGICGEVVGCTNFVDIATKKKYKLDSNRQVDEIRNILLDYNGDNLDYEYIDSVLIDSGSGGGGTIYADQLLSNWVDKTGKEHKGLIDLSSDMYAGYRRSYPDAIDKLRLISPKKHRTQMVEEFIELMELGVIKFPYQYNNSEFLRVNNGVKKIGKDEDGKDILEEQFTNYFLSFDEKLHLVQIDLMKREIASIHKFTNAENTSVTYALAKEKANKMHDDRFYTILLLAHRLYELRRGVIVNKKRSSLINGSSVSSAFQIRKPKLF